MNARKLVDHAKELLLSYELKQMGIPADSVKTDTFKLPDKSKRDFCEPLVVPEEDFLEEYFEANPVTATFMIGPRRRESDLYFRNVSWMCSPPNFSFRIVSTHAKATLKMFYDQTGGRYLHNEYYIFASTIPCSCSSFHVSRLVAPRRNDI